MRHREYLTPGVAMVSWVYNGGSGSSSAMLPFNPSSYYNCSGTISCVMEKSTIDDELSPDGSRLIAHPVVHKRASGAYLDSQIPIWAGSSYPTVPAATLRTRVSICYEPVTPAYQIDWGAALDTLAKLVDTGVSKSAQCLVILYDLKKTIEMIRNPFSILTPIGRRKAKHTPLRGLVKSGANKYLEYTYGWRNLQLDIDTVAKTAATQLYGSPYSQLEEQAARYSSRGTLDLGYQDRIEVCGSGKVSADYAREDLTSGHGVGWFDLRWVRSKVDYAIGCTQSLDAYVRARQTKAFLASYGVAGWRDIRDALWEVIPYSFVADWFIDARGVWAPLNSQRLYQCDIHRLCYSTKYFVEYGVELSPARADGLYYGPWPWNYRTQYRTTAGKQMLSGRPLGKYQVYTRSLGVPDTPMFYSKIAENGLSLIQTANGLSLLLQKLLR